MSDEKKPFIKITKHAYDRAKERLGWKKSALENTAPKAFTVGTKHTDAKSKLRKYFDGIWRKYKNADNCRVHGEVFYLFRQNILITVYPVPNYLKKYLNL